MCCCGKPTINGQPGYSWDGKRFSTRSVDPPELEDGEELLYDGPGRCGRGTDSHCHHFRVTRRHGQHSLLVRHGGGTERIQLGSRSAVSVALSLPGDDCYWMLQMIYHVAQDESRRAVENNEFKWRQAAAEKRIKTRKQRGSEAVKVWIESRPMQSTP